MSTGDAITGSAVNLTPLALGTMMVCALWLEEALDITTDTGCSDGGGLSGKSSGTSSGVLGVDSDRWTVIGFIALESTTRFDPLISGVFGVFVVAEDGEMSTDRLAVAVDSEWVYPIVGILG